MEQKPKNYNDWTVYSLTGIWDISDNSKENYNEILNKDDLVFDLMIRQPDFVSKEFISEMIERTKIKKTNEFLEQIKVKNITDGKCIQMLHIGSFDDEPKSFLEMEHFASTINLERIDKTHREIYLSGFRKVPVEKLKTTLRFKVKDKTID